MAAVNHVAQPFWRVARIKAQEGFLGFQDGEGECADFKTRIRADPDNISLFWAILSQPGGQASERASRSPSDITLSPS